MVAEGRFLIVAQHHDMAGKELEFTHYLPRLDTPQSMRASSSRGGQRRRSESSMLFGGEREPRGSGMGHAIPQTPRLNEPRNPRAKAAKPSAYPSASRSKIWIDRCLSR
jgi:hypothetical protein